MSMTKPNIPYTCDLHGGEINTEKQYLFEVYEGKSSFGKERVKGSNMDICHKCFMDICKQGYVPNWKYSIKNPLWVKGGKEAYWLDKPETDVHIGQEELVTT